MYITLKQLEEHRACSYQRELFKSLFGDKVLVTLSDCIMYADNFDFVWAARNLLSPTQKKAYSKALAPAYRVYYEAVAPARKAYSKAVAPAYKAYNKAKASAFCNAYIN